jgi:phospholipid/cholesterol/gamma-HCH transport system substrate-binding protein
VASYRNEWMLGGFILLSAGLLAYMTLMVGNISFGGGVRVKASFVNASGLVKQAAVSVAGVQVGHVEGLTVEHDKAVVSLYLKPEAQIRKDVEAVIRAKSLLGEKYVELRPRSRDAAVLATGDVIETTRASVEVDDLLAAAAPLLREVNPKDVSTIVRTLAKTLDAEQESLAGVVRNAAAIADELEDVLRTNRKNIDAIGRNLASVSQDGATLLSQNKAALGRSVTNLDRFSAELAHQSPAILRDVGAVAQAAREHAPALLTKAKPALEALPKVALTTDELARLHGEVKTSLHKLNPLLDRAHEIDEAQLQRFTEDVLMRNGIKIFLHPLSPTEPAWRKSRATGSANEPRSKS